MAHGHLPTRVASPLSRRATVLLIAGVLAVAGVWRAVIAATIPCIARDSVTFCEYARELGQGGLAHLREPTTHQHPLLPGGVLAVQRLARRCGAPDSSLTWQRSGQAVSWLAGMAVVALTGAVAMRLVRRLELPVDARLAGCAAMLLAALLPLNVWLSAEVMSDQLHAALYLAGVLALLRLESVRAALLCGLFSALAFLTRPEGMVVMLAGLVVLAAASRVRRPVRLRQAAVMVLTFVACALPYWLTTGTLSMKKNPLQWLDADESARVFPDPLRQGEAVAAVRPGTSPRCCGGSLLLAKLELLDVRWHTLVPYALERLFRAGRVVVVLLAIPPLINLRRQLLRPPLIGLTLCAAGHFLLTLLLLYKYRYLAPRHMLVIVLLLIPFAAMLLARLVDLVRSGRWPATPTVLVIGVVLAPLVAYSLRRPNRQDAYLVDVARWLVQHDPEVSNRLILSGPSLRRSVFYAGARWAYWFEAPEDTESVVGQILGQRPDYFLVETGDGFERQGNEAMVEALRTDARLAPFMREVQTRAVPQGATLHVFAFAWGDG